MRDEWLDVILREVATATTRQAEAYLRGAAHDSYFSSLHNTTRFSQQDRRWLDVVGAALLQLGRKHWIYREGTRDVHVLESSWRRDPRLVPETNDEVAAYVRGYFDAEGGIPRGREARFYIQFVQKDWADLDEVQRFTAQLGLEPGRLHNPSVKVDPDYWRFFLRKTSHQRFLSVVGSWHQRKRECLEQRVSRGATAPTRG